MVGTSLNITPGSQAHGLYLGSSRVCASRLFKSRGDTSQTTAKANARQTRVVLFSSAARIYAKSNEKKKEKKKKKKKFLNQILHLLMVG
jgi:NAD dependent epimerase/dehydratase family enzyme